MSDELPQSNSIKCHSWAYIWVLGTGHLIFAGGPGSKFFKSQFFFRSAPSRGAVRVVGRGGGGG